MDIKLISSILVFCGAIIMLIAILSSNKVRKIVPEPIMKKWLLITSLMVFFLVGYILFMIALLGNFPIPIELLTGCVFLGGAFFVLLMINISNSTIFNIQLKENELKRNKEKVQNALDEISSLMNHVITRDDKKVRYNNPNLSTCYQMMNCDTKECECYEKEAMRCWQIAGTYCEGQVQGSFARKYGDCSNCDVYISATSDPMDEIGECFNNMMTVLELNNQTTTRLKEHSEALTNLNEKLRGEVVERERAEAKLEHMAYYDHLTQIPNRIKFISHIGRLLQRTKQQSDYMFAVLFIDLDRFKVINDSLGHAIGDELLIEVAHRLETCTRPTDKVSRIEDNESVARFGGDEFAVFLHDIKDISSASRVAERIQAELQEPILIDGHELYTSASIGIALSVTGYENAEDILRDADSAMYRAKATGKAHAEIFDEAMHIRVTKILQLESDLRIAIDREQFILYYQPIVSTADHRITGAEALIRWNHPEHGLISPMDFIPIAEETGLISAIGEWVLRTACAQDKAWQDAGYPNLLMKVNFSSRQFQDNNLVELVKIIIRETEIPAQLLDIEITETIAMEKTSIGILNQLTAMGLQTSIDDFGTGYSSLGSLTRFPINTIKIDRTFVKKIGVDINAEAIIKAIIAMAHSLDMELVAEGVETDEQMAYLESQKCDKLQGYLFSPPVSVLEFSKLLEKEKNGSPIISKHSASMA